MASLFLRERGKKKNRYIPSLKLNLLHLVEASQFSVYFYRVVKILLESHKDGILAEDENGDTPLHLAAASGYYLTVKELLKNNADCDAR